MTTQPKLKILFITKWYPNKYDPQMGVFVRKHASAAAAYCDVALLHVFSDEHLKEKMFELVRDDNYNLTGVIVYFKKSNSSFSSWNKLINLKRYCQATRKGLKYIRKNFGEHDITHAYILLRPGIVAWCLRLFRNKPYVISEQWSGFATGKYEMKNSFIKLITRTVVKKANAVTVVSDFLKNHMTRNGLKGNYFVIPNIVEIAELRNRSHDDSKIIILTVADLVDEIKNISGTIRAIADVSRNNPSVELRIIGEGTDRKKLESLAEELDLLDKKVFFLGLKSNDEVYTNLFNCDFLVMNSNFETFSSICAEAFSCGKPVIATRCGGPEEFVTAETGILIDPKNHRQLVEGIQHMINTYQNYLPGNLKKYASENFSSEVAAKKFYQVYQSVLAR
jgi:glycosyltransferase involved in cell wall biosynthesis